MKTQIIKGISLLIGIAMFVSSCNDSNLEQVENNSVQDYSKNYVDEMIKTDYVIKDGVVHFRDPETFKKITSDLDNFIFKFDKKYENFISFNDMILEGQSKYKKANNENEKFRILTDYSAYIKLKANTALPKMLNPFSKFLSKDGAIL